MILHDSHGISFLSAYLLHIPIQSGQCRFQRYRKRCRCACSYQLWNKSDQTRDLYTAQPLNQSFPIQRSLLPYEYPEHRTWEEPSLAGQNRSYLKSSRKTVNKYSGAGWPAHFQASASQGWEAFHCMFQASGKGEPTETEPSWVWAKCKIKLVAYNVNYHFLSQNINEREAVCSTSTDPEVKQLPPGWYKERQAISRMKMTRCWMASKEPRKLSRKQPLPDAREGAVAACVQGRNDSVSPKTGTEILLLFSLCCVTWSCSVGANRELFKSLNNFICTSQAQQQSHALLPDSNCTAYMHYRLLGRWHFQRGTKSH